MTTAEQGVCRTCRRPIYRHDDGLWLHHHVSRAFTHPAEPRVDPEGPECAGRVAERERGEQMNRMLDAAWRLPRREGPLRKVPPGQRTLPPHHMKNLHCPAYIQALLHCHCSPEPLREAPVNEAAVKLLESSGMITPCSVPPGYPQAYTTTPLGAAYVDSLCLLPPPSVVYVDVLGNQFPPRG